MQEFKELNLINENLFLSLIHYFTHVEKVNDIKHDKLQEYFDTFQNNQLDNDLVKYILNIVLLCKASEDHVHLKNIFITISSDIREYLDSLNNYDDIPVYKFLHYKRLYGVDPIIGCFPLSRFKENHTSESLRHISTHTWIYHCAKCPFWYNILNNFPYTWTLCDKTHAIIFDNNNSEESDTELGYELDMDIDSYFHQMYCLEFDEQSIETQLKSTRDLLPRHATNDFIQFMANNQKSPCIIKNLQCFYNTANTANTANNYFELLTNII